MRTHVAAPASLLLGALVLVGALVFFLETDVGPPIDDRRLPAVGLDGGVRDGPVASVALRGSDRAAASSGTSERTAPPVAPRAAVTPETALVEGTVLVSDGTNARDFPVALFARRGVDAVGPPLVEGRTDAHGRFVLSVAYAGEALLLACRPGCEPAAREIVLRLGHELVLGPVEVVEGLAISGAVRAGGTPMTRCEVVAVLDRAGERLEGTQLVRLDGRWTWAFATAETDVDGSYRIGGLARELYQVRVSTIRGMQSVLGLVESSLARDVRAPAEAIDFACPVSTLRFRFVGDDGGPVAGVRAELAASRWSKSATSDERGEVVFRVVPGLACALSAGEPPAHRTVRGRYHSPPTGEERTETVRIPVWRESAKIVLELGAASDESIRTARFYFFPSASVGAAPAFHRDGVGLSPSTEKDAKVREAENARLFALERDGKRSRIFEIENVEAGSYRVLVKAGGTISALGEDAEALPYRILDGRNGAISVVTEDAGLRSIRQFCDEEFLLVVPETGSVEHRLDLVTRGSLVVRALDEDGALVPAHATLRTPSGAVERTQLLVRAATEWRAVDRIDTSLPTRLFASLCAGSFELELFAPGRRTKRLPVAIVAGRITPVEAVLERE